RQPFFSISSQKIQNSLRLWPSTSNPVRVSHCPLQRIDEEGSSMDKAVAQPMMVEDTAFVRFWNDVLAPKFIRFKHILVDGLSHHSEAVFPSLPVNEGDHVLDVGCGF